MAGTQTESRPESPLGAALCPAGHPRMGASRPLAQVDTAAGAFSAAPQHSANYSGVTSHSKGSDELVFFENGRKVSLSRCSF